MTPITTLFNIQSFLSEKLKEFRFDGDNGDERAVTVYAFHLPEPPQSAMRPRAEDGISPDMTEAQRNEYEGFMPAVIVRPLKYENKAFSDNSSLLAVGVSVGVFSRDPENKRGSWGVVNILERIRQEIEKQHIIDGTCEILEPLTWELYDEELRPLWFGEMILSCRIANPQREYGKDEDWLGDFIQKKEDSNGENN